MFRRVVPLLLLVPIALCHPGVHVGRAQAHPGGAALGQRLEATLTPTDAGIALELVYVAELPAIRLQSDARPMGLLPGVPTPVEAVERHSARLARELADGVRVAWDGAPVVLEVVDDGPPTRPGEGGFVEFHVHKRGVLPAQVGELRLVSGNFPDEGGYFATSVAVDGGLVVTASSLAGVKDGHVTKNRHGAWLRDESAREQVVAVRPADLWERREGSFVLPERLEGLDSLRPPVREIGVGVGLLLVTSGLLWWRWQRRRAA